MWAANKSLHSEQRFGDRTPHRRCIIIIIVIIIGIWVVFSPNFFSFVRFNGCNTIQSIVYRYTQHAHTRRNASNLHSETCVIHDFRNDTLPNEMKHLTLFPSNDQRCGWITMLISRVGYINIVEWVCVCVVWVEVVSVVRWLVPDSLIYVRAVPESIEEQRTNVLLDDFSGLIALSSTLEFFLFCILRLMRPGGDSVPMSFDELAIRNELSNFKNIQIQSYRLRRWLVSVSKLMFYGKRRANAVLPRNTCISAAFIITLFPRIFFLLLLDVTWLENLFIILFIGGDKLVGTLISSTEIFAFLFPFLYGWFVCHFIESKIIEFDYVLV